MCHWLKGRCTPVVRWGLLAALTAFASQLHAQDAAEGYDALWSRARLYTGDSDSIIKSVTFSGRFQVDQAYVDSGAEEHSETNLRRMRLGIKMAFLERFLAHAEAEYDPQDGEPVYQRLTDTYIAWSSGDALTITVGKQGAGFTMDGMTSSKELIAIDRSALTNNIWFTQEYIPGVSVSGDVGKFSYDSGIYTSGDINRGFGDSNGGEFFLGTVGYNFAERFEAEKAVFKVNYVDNEPDPDNGFTQDLEQIVSITFDFAKDRWGVRSDVSLARGYFDQSDLSALMVMPYLNLSRLDQLVWRYTYVDSKDPNGVRLGRYEREIESGSGDEYSEIYFGWNHYWYGHKLKLQSGLQYVDMNDRAADGGAYTGWAWTTGFRISW